MVHRFVQSILGFDQLALPLSEVRQAAEKARIDGLVDPDRKDARQTAAFAPSVGQAVAESRLHPWSGHP